MGSYSLLVYLGLTNYCDTHGCGSILREFLCHVETLGTLSRMWIEVYTMWVWCFTLLL